MRRFRQYLSTRTRWIQIPVSSGGESLISAAISAAVIAGVFTSYAYNQGLLNKVASKDGNFLANTRNKEAVVGDLKRPFVDFLFDRMNCGDIGGASPTGRPAFLDEASPTPVESVADLSIVKSSDLASLISLIESGGYAAGNSENYTALKDFCLVNNFTLEDNDTAIKFCVKVAWPANKIPTSAHQTLPAYATASLNFKNMRSGTDLTCDDFVSHATPAVLGAELVYDLYSFDRNLDSVAKASGKSYVSYPERKLMFVTATTYDAEELGGASGANSICTEAARANNLVGIYKALLSTDSNEAINTFSFVGGLYSLMGRRYASTTSDLWASPLPYANIYTETGAPLPGPEDTWTGTADDGASASHCDNWTSNSATGTYGVSDDAATWAEAGTDSCSMKKHIYCVRQ